MQKQKKIKHDEKLLKQIEKRLGHVFKKENAKKVDHGAHPKAKEKLQQFIKSGFTFKGDLKEYITKRNKRIKESLF